MRNMMVTTVSTIDTLGPTSVRVGELEEDGHSLILTDACVYA